MAQTSTPGIGLRRIVLTGFMGSGKTTVGRVLAGRLGWRFEDLDERVAARYGAGVPEIFRQHGEPFFRALELDVLQELLREPELVLALGGGAVETPELRESLMTAPGTQVVHLDAPFHVLFDRCARQSLDPAATVRPLLGTRQAAEGRFERRQVLYAGVRHARVEASLPAPDDVAEAILVSLGLQVPQP